MKQANKVIKFWDQTAKEFNLEIDINGLPTLANFTVRHPEWLKIKTFITHEALKKNMLISNSFYMSSLHDDEALNKYFNFIRIIFKKISNNLDEKKFKINLEAPQCHEGFKRLN